MRKTVEAQKRRENKTQCQQRKRLAGPFIPPFLVLSGLEKGLTFDVITSGHLTIIFLCIGPFFHGDTQTNDQTNKQPGDLSASLLLTSEKAIFCKKGIFSSKAGPFHNFLTDMTNQENQ